MCCVDCLIIHSVQIESPESFRPSPMMSTNLPAPAADAAADAAAADAAAPSPIICPAVGRDSPPPATQAQINAAVAQEIDAQEDNAISESVDVSGGASEALDDAVLNLHAANQPTKQSIPRQPQGGKSKTPTIPPKSP